MRRRGGSGALVTTDPRTPKPIPAPEAVALPIWDQLNELLRRREAGELSEDEYQAAKAERMKRI